MCSLQTSQLVQGKSPSDAGLLTAPLMAGLIVAWRIDRSSPPSRRRMGFFTLSKRKGLPHRAARMTGDPLALVEDRRPRR
jgi:hypothetical protein